MVFTKWIGIGLWIAYIILGLSNTFWNKSLVNTVSPVNQ